jgi:predicted dehydrogenase
VSKSQQVTKPVRVVLIGCGDMTRFHLKSMLSQLDNTEYPVVCDPSPDAYSATADLFEANGYEIPPNEPDLERLLSDYDEQLDAAFIVTPHLLHHDQTAACLEAGLDVLLEKPMVMTADEAESLIRIRDQTGSLLVVAFNGSLSPAIRKAASMLRAGELGDILSISATVWQNWRQLTEGTWRQVPELAGGGFLFDTGAHMLNTVADLAGEDFVEVAAWFDNRGTDVEVNGVAMARLESGAFVSFHASGDTAPSCTSDVYVFCIDGIIRTSIWGRFLEVQGPKDLELLTVPLPSSSGSWEQFLAVRDGLMPNPSPAEVGLRMAKLYDSIRLSAAQGGQPVGVNKIAS